VDVDDPELAELGHLNRLEFERTLTRWSGRHGRVVEADGLLTWASASDFPVLLNGAARIDPDADPERTVALAAERFAPLTRGFSMSLRDGHPEDEPVRAAALAVGCLEVSSAPEMVVTERLGAPAPRPDVRLRWASGDADVDDFVAVSDTAYQSLGMPPGALRAAITSPRQVTRPGTSIVLADLADEPVGAAMALLSHGIAGVYFVGTVEAARGCGIGELVTRAVTDRAFDLGAAAVTLQASPMGEAIYARMGYVTAYRYTTFLHLPG
jgi:hypothetical protein